MNTNEKLREALSDACYAMFNFLKTQNGGCEEMAKALDKAKAALALPRRNCDVGTEKEQDLRFVDFCGAYSKVSCTKCPVYRSSCCELAWAQLPYEKEGI